MRLSLIFLIIEAVFATNLFARDFESRIEKDFSFKNSGALQFTNLRGNLEIRGWALDKIKVKATRHAQAESEQEAQRLLGSVDIQYRIVEGTIELGADYGKGLELGERLLERQARKTSMDLVIFAPSTLPVRALTAQGKVTIKNWNAPLEARTSSGGIAITSVKAKSISLFCPDCAIEARQVRGGLRAMGGAGSIELGDADGPSIYAETDSGSLKLNHIRGEQLYVTRGGAVAGGDLNGRIEFHTQSGSVELKDCSGFVSGNSRIGELKIGMKKWDFSDKAIIETKQGAVFLSLPENFEGDVDFSSGDGQVRSDFFVKTPISKEENYGPRFANRIQGKIGRGGELLKVFSLKGDVVVTKTRP